jgi:hypothetical protein
MHGPSPLRRQPRTPRHQRLRVTTRNPDADRLARPTGAPHPDIFFPTEDGRGLGIGSGTAIQPNRPR